MTPHTIEPGPARRDLSRRIHQAEIDLHRADRGHDRRAVRQARKNLAALRSQAAGYRRARA